MTPSTLVSAIFLFFSGACVGSFISSYVLRSEQGEGVLMGRSHCPHCKKALGPLDLVPLVSFLLLRGRCRACGQKISRFYPLVEAAAGLFALWAYLVLPGWLALAGAILAWALLAASLVDARREILPDILTLPLVLLGIAVTWLNRPDQLLPHLLGALAGYLAIVGIMFLYKRLRKRDGIGMGDAKLLAAAGAWLGWAGLPSVIVIASLGGLAWLAVAALRGQALSADKRLPFGPFLAGAFWLVWLYGPLVLQ